MSRRVVILGIGADGPAGLAPEARALIDSADFLAGGRRHLALIGPTEAETFTIADNLPELADRLAWRRPDELCVVLASGDPLFFGIGHYLGERLGRDALDVRPALSSMQLAFARVGVSWHDAALASVHGRPLEATLRPLLGRPKIGLFTRDGRSPSEIARFFFRHGVDNYLMTVAERLGTPHERIVTAPLDEFLEGSEFADLNVVILCRETCLDIVPSSLNFSDGEPLNLNCPVPGLPDDLFARPDTGPVLLTHADVRAVTLARFRDLPDGPIWDLGAGLGGVSVELARAFPAREVIAVERSEERAGYLKTNRLRFAAYNLQFIEDEASEFLGGDPPAAIFLGGSGGQLDAILDLVAHRLLPGGVFVANFVGLENLTRTLDRLRALHWPAEVTHLQISQTAPLAGLTTFVPIRPVWILRAVKPPAV